jgi:hypothetical protein
MKAALWVLTCMALLALAVLAIGSSASASDGGNAASAQLCQKNGWVALFRSSDGSTFSNEGDCVSDGARGGAYSQLKIERCPEFELAGICLTATGFGLLPGSTVTLFMDLGGGAGNSSALVGSDGVLGLPGPEAALICGSPATFSFSAHAIGTTAGGAPITTPTLSGEVVCP